LAKRRLYWDSCAFLGLINNEAAKHARCNAVWDEAVRGEAEIYTSFFAFAEVYKAKCEGTRKPLLVSEEDRVVQFMNQEFVFGVVVDETIGIAARRLMRQYGECKKPTDAIHLATALRLNVDEMHTYDGSDLLGLNGKVRRQDGVFLEICIPRVPIPPPVVEGPGDNFRLFESEKK
jgi:predicted nucleic acid-binding protein